MKKAAAEAGDESPIVFVFLPKHDGDQIKDALASYARRRGHPAPARPPDRRGQGRAQAMPCRPDSRPTTNGSPPCSGRRRTAPASSRAAAPSSRPSSLRDAVETAANRSLIRLFPKFGPATTPTGARSSPKPAMAPPMPSTPLATTASQPTQRGMQGSPRCDQPPVAPRAPTSRSGSRRRRTAGRRTP